jgi:hypothetical protein
MNELPGHDGKNEDRYLDATQRVMAYAEAQCYSGYSKFDACNSPYVRAATLGNKWLRGAAILSVNRFPYNIRPLLGVKKSVNPKGMALFARAYFDLYQATGGEEFLDKGKSCIDWLIKNPSRGYSGICWGYNFDWQSLLFYAPRHTPNCVVTVFAGEALIRAYETTGDASYLGAAQDATRFLLRDLPVLHEDERMKCVSYVPAKVSTAVLNINAILAAFLAKVWKHTKDETYLAEAGKLLEYVIINRTGYGAWYYTTPPGNSPIRHDNYHTGGILDAILEYSDYTGKREHMGAYGEGLSYYRKNLFMEDGAPKWMNDQIYPHDIHGSAQGIITFAKAARIDGRHGEFARKIADWALDNLYDAEKGLFYYQQGRFITHRFTLMRWCNAWMCRALSEMVLDGKRN